MAAPLRELLREAGVARLVGSDEVVVRGLRHDSRQVQPGDLFFALCGARTDGNRFVKAALERGARVVVSELDAPPPPVCLDATWVRVADAALAMGRIADRFFGHPSGAMKVIGVTGTNGKTTTTYFLESIVAACGGTAAVVGTVDYRLAGRAIEKAPNTTPISLELLRLLARFRDGGATHVAMEASSHALALKRVEEVDFDAAIFTNISRDHLDFHKTPEDYFEAKARLFDLLTKPSSSKKDRVAAINADDARAAALRRRAAGARTLLFGLAAGADVRAERPREDVDGTSFELVFAGKAHPARIRLAGLYNVSNALGAAAAALGLGLPMGGVLQGLEALAGVPGRLERVDEGQPFGVFVDFAHTESALAAALSCLSRLPHKRLIAVFGCGGERDRGKRGPMGAAACRGSDLAVVTSDNPRREDPLAIIGEIEEGIRAAGLKNYKIQPDRKEAIELAVAQARPGDLVLIAGKGHEGYQILKEGTVAFDDREQARAALRRLKRP